MVITTMLLWGVAREKWGWSVAQATAMAVFFLAVDLSFFGANIIKVANGGWFPLAVAAVVFTLMTTWWRGRLILSEKLRAKALPVDVFLADVAARRPIRVPGTAVYMSRDPDGTPLALLHNFKHNKVLHERVVFLTVLTAEIPFVRSKNRLDVRVLGGGVFRVVARYGFQENAHIPELLSTIDVPGLEFPPADTTFFLAKETILATKRPGMALWREGLFGVMLRNAGSATAFFSIPPDRVVELGAQVEI